MSAKLHKIDELSKLLDDKNELAGNLMDLYRHFNLSQAMASCKITKFTGVSCSLLMLFLILSRLMSISKYQLYRHHYFDLAEEEVGKNCIYRFVNNPRFNWRSLLYAVVKSFFKNLNKSLEKSGATSEGKKAPTFFVMDDTTLSKTGIAMENISRVFDHTVHKCILGFKCLTLGFFDGKSLIPVDFALLSEKGKNGKYGLTAKEIKGRFRKQRDPRSQGCKRDKESRMTKIDLALSILKRVCKHGYHADYFLADSWFDGIGFIKQIREIANGAMHVICMAKNGNRKYSCDDHIRSAHEMIALYERTARPCRKYKCLYFDRLVQVDGLTVRLFFVKYGHKGKWNILLSTDTSLKFIKVFEYYQVRWTTEVMYRECKQHLGLGKCQSNDFDAQIADCTLVFITYTMMTLRKRLNDYESYGALFREMGEEIGEMTLWQRILPLVKKLLMTLCEVLGVDYLETMESIAESPERENRICAVIRALEMQDAA